MSTIATTEKIERRLEPLRRNGIQNNYFIPDTIDLFRKHNNITVNGQNIFDDNLGYERLINNRKYNTLQINWIKKVMLNNPNKRVRHLTILPENYNNYNSLRDSLISIESSAGLSERFIFVEKSETSNAIQIYASSLSNLNNCVLVLDENMSDKEFINLVKWGIERLKEIVIIYKDWEKNRLKYSFLLSLSQIYKQKLHIALIPLSINKYSKERLISTIFICQGIGSISFKDPEIPLVMISRICNKPRKTQIKKLDDSLWVNINSMTYDTTHQAGCNCFGNRDILSLDVDSCITYHNLELLSKIYNLLLINPMQKVQMLQLQSLQPIARKLGIIR